MIRLPLSRLAWSTFFLFACLLLDCLSTSICLSQSPRKPLVIAHRGGYGRYPENTIPAFITAREVGVDYVECDVHLTADSVTVVIHDETFGRTTNVEEVFGSDKRIRDLTLSEVKYLRIDAGAGWSEQFRETLTVPTLAEVLSVLKGSQCGIIIDMKDHRLENQTNIVEAIVESGIDPQRVFVGEWVNLNWLPSPMKLLLWDINRPSVPNAIFRPNWGVDFDGTYYLSMMDTTLKKDRLSISFYVPQLNKSGSALLKIIDHQNWGDCPLRVRFDTDSIVISAPSVNSRSSRVKFYPDVRITINVVGNVASLEHGDEMVTVQMNKSLGDLRMPRIIIGKEEGDAFGFTLRKAVVFSASDTLGLFDFSKGSEGLTSNGLSFAPGSFFNTPADYLGIPSSDYSVERSKAYRDLGYGVIVWTLEDINEIRTVSLDPNVDGIVTGFPSLVLDQPGLPSVPIAPKELAIDGFPNPFQNHAAIRYFVPEAGQTALAIYDILGRRIRVLMDAIIPVGINLTLWDGKTDEGADAPSGVYFCRLEANGRSFVRKLALTR